MTKFLKRFRQEESGAVTVDWVVLTAAMVGMAIGVVTIVRTAATDPAESVGAALTAQTVGS
ncbi:MAG: hypothetical protein GW886_02985 [Rhodobacterales bacterium]|nr:hypothetical protein [Rhodobacterales bacterium]NCT11183.1 hypothetical protein [Rhodobacterales bacterium]